MKRLLLVGFVLACLPSMAFAGRSSGFISFGYRGGGHHGNAFAFSVGYGHGGYGHGYGHGRYYGGYHHGHYGGYHGGHYARAYYRPYYRPVYYAPPPVVYYAPAPVYYGAPAYCPPRSYYYDNCDYYRPAGSFSVGYRYYR
jgi:hypothetical protein